MLSPLSVQSSASPREKLLWAVVGALAIGQLIAFWMLCNQQVRKAQMRDATQQSHRLALADCVRHTPRATWSSCVARLDPSGHQDTRTLMTASEARGDLNSTVPVNFVFR